MKKKTAHTSETQAHWFEEVKTTQKHKRNVEKEMEHQP